MNVNTCYRKTGVNLPTKKLVPAHVVPATTAADVQTTSADKMTPSSAASADTVASAAVAAVVASQTYMKVSAFIIVTGSFARSATRQYLSYSEADFEGFSPCRGRHVAPMGVKYGVEEGTFGP